MLCMAFDKLRLGGCGIMPRAHHPLVLRLSKHARYAAVKDD